MSEQNNQMPEIQPMFNPRDPAELDLYGGSLRVFAQNLRGIAGGEIVTRTHGIGAERDDVRAYVIGDDVRDIDWHVTARDPSGGLHVRRRYQDTKANVWVVSDALKGLDTLNGGEFHESELGLSAVHRVVTLARRSGLRYGVALTTDYDAMVLKPNEGRNHTMAIYEGINDLIDDATERARKPTKLPLFARSPRQIEQAEPKDPGSLGELISHIGTHSVRDVVVVVSNFRDVMDPHDQNEGWVGPMVDLQSRRNHIRAVQLTNPWYDRLPNEISKISGPQTKGSFIGRSGKRGKELREVAAQLHHEQGTRITDALSQADAHVLLSTTDTQWLTTLDTELHITKA